MKSALRTVIRIYRTIISPFIPPSCRFTPTCSAYALDALESYGPIKALWMTLKRLSKCHPFYKGNLADPVPPNDQDKTMQ